MHKKILENIVDLLDIQSQINDLHRDMLDHVLLGITFIALTNLAVMLILLLK